MSDDRLLYIMPEQCDIGLKVGRGVPTLGVVCVALRSLPLRRRIQAKVAIATGK